MPICRPSTARWRCAGAIPRPCSAPSPPAWSRSTPPGASPPSTAPPSACSASPCTPPRACPRPWCCAGPTTRRSPPSSRAWRGSARARWSARCTSAATARPSPCSPPPPRSRARTGRDMGMVLVFDDLTELLKAQRLAAWREVAQRIAHEIKNPLTPIQLSAQRLRRRLGGDRSADEKRLLDEATSTIIQEVDGLKQLVDEFSRFARMPALSLRSTDLARLLDGVCVLYRESHPALGVKSALSPPTCRPSRWTRTRSSAPCSTSSTTPSRRWVRPARSSSRRGGCRTRGAPASWWRTPGRGSAPRTRSASSSPTSRPRPPAWAWGCPSSTRSSPTTAAPSGSRTISPRAAAS